MPSAIGSPVLALAPHCCNVYGKPSLGVDSGTVNGIESLPDRSRTTTGLNPENPDRNNRPEHG